MEKIGLFFNPDYKPFGNYWPFFGLGKGRVGINFPKNSINFRRGTFKEGRKDWVLGLDSFPWLGGKILRKADWIFKTSFGGFGFYWNCYG